METRNLVLIVLISFVFTCSCKKLNETVGGNLTTGQVANNSAAELLRGVYASLAPTFTSYLDIFALSDMTTDEAIVPTRGNDWDDNGMWRLLHQHKWDPGHQTIRDCFKSLAGVVFAATDILQYNPNAQQKAEAKFLRAWAMYWLLDLFDQVPYREPGENIVQPAKVRKGIVALDYIIGEINDAQPDLPDGPAGKANKFAARALLMKCYLNKGVYADRANPSFDPLDMDKIIRLADTIINSNKYFFSEKYFDNFCPDNKTKGKENIFTQASNSDGGYLLGLAWSAPLHYKQGGFNGTTTLSDFYNKFESTDKRREAVYDYPNAPPNPGRRVNVGFLIGPQYDLVVDTLLISSENVPVIFTPEVKNIEPGPDLDNPGIRPIKYAPDYLNFYFYLSPATNDFVYFRFPDVLLMKAEAILRGGTPTYAGSYGISALSIVNSIRTDPSRNASALSSINLDVLYDERGRELWWENWRRQDMIRFGEYLLPFQEKYYQSDPKYLLFPIPYEQLSVNPNLKQNEGY
ncbi:MAG: RagB/SusD family nutrient uptake outer membrane protein [Flavitalea sp.]